MNMTERDLKLINSVSKVKFNTIEEVKELSKDGLFNLINSISRLIGYDSETDDIDALGLEADNLISKILVLLEKRGEM